MASKYGAIARALKKPPPAEALRAADVITEGPRVEAVASPLVIKPKADINVMPQLAERYPIVEQAVKAIDARTGKEFMPKVLSEEAQEAQAMRKLIQRDIAAGRYEPYFPIERRLDVDPSAYPEHQSTLAVRKVKPETQGKYEAHARSPEATQRLNAAFERGLQQVDVAGNWYYMGQLEKEYIKEYGPTVGRALFKTRFPDAMAATTGGADPSSNLIMAHLGNFLQRQGKPMPTAAHEFPFPVGGRYITGNMEQYRKMIMENAGVTPANPKRYNFSENFLGRKSPTIDEQMSGLFDPAMVSPPGGTYGHYQGAIEDLARRQGVDPRFYQEVAWAGAKDEKTKGGYRAGPMIDVVNQAIERTPRLTGVPPEDVVRRALVRAEMPLYASGGSVVDRALDVVRGGYEDGGAPVRDEDVYGPANIEERRARVQALSEAAQKQYPGDAIEAPYGYITPAAATSVKTTELGPVPVGAGGDGLSQRAADLVRETNALARHADIDVRRFATLFRLASTNSMTQQQATKVAADVLNGDIDAWARRFVEFPRSTRIISRVNTALGGNAYKLFGRAANSSGNMEPNVSAVGDAPAPMYANGGGVDREQPVARGGSGMYAEFLKYAKQNYPADQVARFEEMAQGEPLKLMYAINQATKNGLISGDPAARQKYQQELVALNTIARSFNVSPRRAFKNHPADSRAKKEIDQLIDVTQSDPAPGFHDALVNLRNLVGGTVVR